MSAFLRRLWQKIRKPTDYVGRDLEGNTFYEYPNLNGTPRPTKRVVKYKKGRDMWYYIAGDKRIAAQWMSWLTFTRAHPPTLEELQADLERQRRVKLNAATIEARDREERAWIQQAEAQAVADALATTSTTAAPTPEPATTTSDAPKSDTASHPVVASKPVEQPIPPQFAAEAQPSDFPLPPPQSDEPQSWSPRTMRRRGG